jgi:hypothetical protein
MPQKHPTWMSCWLALAFSSVLVAAEPALPPVPAALTGLQAKIGERYYSFKGPYLAFRAEQPLTDEQWQAVEGLGFKIIATGGKGIDDSAVARLAKLDLEVLSLDGAELTDAGCKHLTAMKSLRSFTLIHNSFGKKEFTGSGLAQLKDLPALESFTLAGASTGEEAMTAVGELTQLKEFATWHTKQIDPRNSHLLKLTALKSLSLGNNLSRYDGNPRQLSFTDATLETLGQMKSLHSLTLMEARLSLPALTQLKSLPELKKLKLSQIDIRSDDVEKLRKELPNVAIEWKPLTDAERTKLIEGLFTFQNNQGMKFVWIPPGSFLMGSPKEEKARKQDETQHPVKLTKGFYMGVCPVTQEEWTKLMGNNPSKFYREKNLPVEQVNWTECQEFIQKLQTLDKRPYRLPTEAEWEYACRAGTTTPFYFGETISTDQANYNGA